jgi:hypothetical protein
MSTWRGRHSSDARRKRGDKPHSQYADPEQRISAHDQDVALAFQGADVRIKVRLSALERCWYCFKRAQPA